MHLEKDRTIAVNNMDLFKRENKQTFPIMAIATVNHYFKFPNNVMLLQART